MNRDIMYYYNRKKNQIQSYARVLHLERRLWIVSWCALVKIKVSSLAKGVFFRLSSSRISDLSVSDFSVDEKQKINLLSILLKVG